MQESENKSLLAKQKKSVKCFECNKTGHVKKNCYIFIEKCKKKKEKNDRSQGHKAKQGLVAKGQDSDDEVTLFVSALSTSDTCNDSWVFDSGATQHMCNDKFLFSNFVNLSTSVKVEVGDGRPLTAVGEGSVSLKVNLPNKVENRILEKVLYVPDLAHNLISISQVTLGGKITKFYEHSCKIFRKENKLLAVGKRLGKLYMLDCFQKTAAHCSHVCSDEVLWHRRFCHLGMNNVRKLISKDLVNGIDCKITKDSLVCENCSDGKIHRAPFPVGEGNIEYKMFDLIHSDVCGKLNPGSLGGGNYFVTFIDDASRYVWVYILKNKGDVFNAFKSWKTLVENQYEKKIKIFRTDNGAEYTSVEFERYLQDEGIWHEKTIPNS